jgi:hypothetical protein
MVGTTAAAAAEAAEEEWAMEGAVAEAADAAVAAAAARTSQCVNKTKIKRRESTSESPKIYLVNVEKVSSQIFNHVM